MQTNSTHSYSTVTPSLTPPSLRWQANAVLAEISPLDMQRIGQLLRPVLLYEGQMLYSCGQNIEKIYFVTAGLLSGVLTTSDGKGIEVGLIGAEGMVGGLEALTRRPAGAQWIVQAPGKALAMPADAFCQEFRRGGILQQKTLEFVHQQLANNAQCCLCNAIHCVEQRLARWLLMAQDRVQRNELELTHELIAQTLGVRRSGITIAAGTLKAAGLISYTRGAVRILDREGLEAAACECYRVMSHARPDASLAVSKAVDGLSQSSPLTKTALDGSAVNRVLVPNASMAS